MTVAVVATDVPPVNAVAARLQAGGVDAVAHRPPASIAPVADTPALAGAFKRVPELRPRIEARTQLERIGDAERDIGPVVAVLASGDAACITGQTIVGDGGSFTGL